MLIGVPKEIKTHEYRVGLTPDNVKQLVSKAHSVFVQAGAGVAIGFSDEQYESAGAQLVQSAGQLYSNAELIVKVKEPQPSEINLIKPNHIIFGYLHLAASRTLTTDLIETGACCVAYETIIDQQGAFPLLAPMSQVAGRYAVQAAALYLTNPLGGNGVLLGGVTGVAPAKVLVIGAGVVGTEAARIALGLGAQVTLIDRSLAALHRAENVLGEKVTTLIASDTQILDCAKHSQLIVGAVLVAGAKAPRVLSREDLKELQPGTVLVDVAIDQGGCFESSRATTHDNPVYIEEDIIHYCVANIPGAVARTATWALSNATLPYVIQLAEKGRAGLGDRFFHGGVNIMDGQLMNRAVADAHQLPFLISSNVAQ